MKKFDVVVRRILREDVVITIEAETADEARTQATLDAPYADGWETYDCEYFCDPGDVQESQEDN